MNIAEFSINKSVITWTITLLLLVVGFIYEWKKGALEWE